MTDQSDNPVNPEAEGLFEREGDVSKESLKEAGSEGDQQFQQFMEAIDQQVNPSMYQEADSSDQATSEETSPETATSSETSPEAQEEIDYKTRYADSTREAQRLLEEKKALEEKLSELEPVMPIMRELQNDQQLVKHVRNYFEQGGDTPASVKDDLALPDDFVVDYDEAVRNPDSVHGKVVRTMTEKYADAKVEERMTQLKQEQQQQLEQQQQQQQMQQFMQKQVAEDERKEFQQFLKNHQVTLEDAYKLYKGQGRDQEIAKQTQQETKKQLQQTKKSSSLASKNSAQPPEKPVETKLFDLIKGVDSDAENVFGS